MSAVREVAALRRSAPVGQAGGIGGGGCPVPLAPSRRPGCAGEEVRRRGPASMDRAPHRKRVTRTEIRYFGSLVARGGENGSHSSPPPPPLLSGRSQSTHRCLRAIMSGVSSKPRTSWHKGSSYMNLKEDRFGLLGGTVLPARARTRLSPSPRPKQKKQKGVHVTSRSKCRSRRSLPEVPPALFSALDSRRSMPACDGVKPPSRFE